MKKKIINIMQMVFGGGKNIELPMQSK